jgi:hypothetical protein
VHLEDACGEEDVAVTIAESAARLGVRRAEPSQRNELANTALGG